MNHQKSWKNLCSMTLKFASGCKKRNKLIHQLLCSVYNQQKLDSWTGAELLKKKNNKSSEGRHDHQDLEFRKVLNHSIFFTYV